MKINTNELGHMTSMAAMPINSTKKSENNWSNRLTYFLETIATLGLKVA